MAGVKGRSGGARPGAGRPPAPAQKLGIEARQYDDPAEFLLDVVNDSSADAKLRLEAAKALLARGKKQGQREQAGKVATGKFTAARPPGKIVDFNDRR